MLREKTVPSTRTKPLPSRSKVSADELLGGAFDDFDNLTKPLARLTRPAMDLNENFVAVDSVERMMARR